MFERILLLVVFVGMFSCKKDKTPFPFEPQYNDLAHGWYTEDCSDSWPDHWVDSFNLNSYYVDDHVVFKVPQFNPSNPDEIVYYHINYTENIRQLVKYNIKTTEKTILTNGMNINGEPSWSSSGWIAFASTPSYQIFIVSENDNQVQQISNNHTNLYPQWSPDGNYAYWGLSQVLGQNTHWVRKNISMNTIDTLIFGNYDPSYISPITKISHSNLLFSVANIGQSLHYIYSDLTSLPVSLNPLLNISTFEPGYTSQYCWSHDSQYIYLAYYATGDIYRVAVATGEIEQIRGDCFGRWLHSIDASPDGKYLVVEKVDLRFTILPDGWASSAVRMRSHVTLIDLQTGQMKDLDLE